MQFALKICVLGGFLLPTLATAQPPIKVVVEDGKVMVGGPPLPVDLTPAVRIGTSGGFRFGLQVDGKNLCCSPEGSIWLNARVDGQVIFVGDDANFVPNNNPPPLPPGPHGKKRFGTQMHAKYDGLDFNQVLEIFPGKPLGKPVAGQKRRLDTCRITYIVENKSNRERNVELRTGIDILLVNNDGALFASPVMFPGKVLNGIELKEKTLPDFVQVLERPNLDNPGFVAVMTLKHGRGVDGPNKVVLTNLGAMGQQWDIPAIPAGDAACAIFFPARKLKPGEKKQFVWSYGGSLGADPENDGRVKLALSGSLAPGKMFTLTGQVEDPAPGQSLRLELPEGMERLEGREIQPVPDPADVGVSQVLWKARVLRPGNYEVKVHSSTGTTEIKKINIIAGS